MDLDEPIEARPSRIKRPPERFNVVPLASAFDELGVDERAAALPAAVAGEGNGSDDDADERDRSAGVAAEESVPEDDEDDDQDAYVDSDEEASRLENLSQVASEALSFASSQPQPQPLDKGKGRAGAPELDYLVEYEVR